MALYERTEEWRAVRGADQGFDALCRVTKAQRTLERFEAKVVQLAYLKEEITRAREERGEAHLGPWRPSAEDLAAVGVKPKRRRSRAF